MSMSNPAGEGLELFDQWATARPLLRGFPAWVGGADRDRIAAYSLYEQIYWNIPEAFKLIQRGSEDNPIYIPAARKIIETAHRYLAKDMNVIVDPNTGTPGDQVNAQAAIDALFARERFYSKFNTNKRYGLIRGDWMFHLYADPARPQGARISIFPIDPASIFPIYNEENLDEIIGYHVVEQVVGVDDGKPYIDRLTYRKESGTGGPSVISVEELLFEVDKWGGPGMDEKQVSVVIPFKTLPPDIDQLPIYHIRNFEEPGSVFGSSELRGLERLLAAINQAISDEELSLALEGLGVYTSTAGSPVDEDTQEPVPWTIGPGRVIELPNGKTFQRVQGVSSITPYGDHLAYLHRQLDLATGSTKMTSGDVDVQLAESGIALFMDLQPLFSRLDEKEISVTDVLRNMLYDIRKWIHAYEGQSFGDVLWIPRYGERIPPNRKDKFAEIIAIAGLTVGGQAVVSAVWIRDQLRLLGYVIDEATVAAAITDASTAQAQLQADVMGARLTAALAGQGAGGTGAGGAGGGP
jgi:hypothetical protein